MSFTTSWRLAHPVNIYVYRNGVVGEKPQLVHISMESKKSMTSVLEAVENRLKLPVGYPIALYNMDGTRVVKSYQLEMYNNYVVVTNLDKRFKPVNYGEVKDPLVVIGNDSKHFGTNKNFVAHNKKMASKPKIPKSGTRDGANRSTDRKGIAVINQGRNRPTECCSDEIMYVEENDLDNETAGEEKDKDKELENTVREEAATAAAASVHLIDLIHRYKNIGSDVFRMFQDKIKRDLDSDLGPKFPVEGLKTETKRRVKQELLRIARESCHNRFGKTTRKKSTPRNVEPSNRTTEVYAMTTAEQATVKEGYSKKAKSCSTLDRDNNNCEFIQDPLRNYFKEGEGYLNQHDQEEEEEENKPIQATRSTSTCGFEVCRASSVGIGSTTGKYFPKMFLEQVTGLLNKTESSTSLVNSKDSSMTFTVGPPIGVDRSKKFEKGCSTQTQATPRLRQMRNVCAQAGSPSVRIAASRSKERRTVLPSPEQRPIRVIDKYPRSYPETPTSNKTNAITNYISENSSGDDTNNNRLPPPRNRLELGKYRRKRRKDPQNSSSNGGRAYRSRCMSSNPLMHPPPPPPEFCNIPPTSSLPIGYPYNSYPQGLILGSDFGLPPQHFQQPMPVPHQQQHQPVFLPHDTVPTSASLPTPSTLLPVLTHPNGMPMTAIKCPPTPAPGSFHPSLPMGRYPTVVNTPQQAGRLVLVPAHPQPQQQMLVMGGGLPAYVRTTNVATFPPNMITALPNYNVNNTANNVNNRLVRLPMPVNYLNRTSLTTPLPQPFLIYNNNNNMNSNNNNATQGH